MTDDALKQAADNLKLLINDGVRFPYSGSNIISELVRRWAEAKSVAAEAEAARHGAVECANRLREQLAEAIEPHNRTIDESQEAMNHSDDLAEALVDAASLRDADRMTSGVKLEIWQDSSWLLRNLVSEEDMADGENIHTAAAAIRAAIASKPTAAEKARIAFDRLAPHAMNETGEYARLLRDIKPAIEAFVASERSAARKDGE